jgi:hypothetical protein
MNHDSGTPEQRGRRVPEPPPGSKVYFAACGREYGSTWFDCPHCGAHHSLSDALAGREHCCQSCGKKFLVPQGEHPVAHQGKLQVLMGEGVIEAHTKAAPLSAKVAPPPLPDTESRTSSVQENSPPGKCDVCGSHIEQGRGYLLTTRQVVSSQGYWSQVFSKAGLRFDSNSGNPQQNVNVVHQKADIIFQTIGSSSPWMTCESCIGLFDVNRDEARHNTGRWYQTGGKSTPPGSGAVSFSDADIPFSDPMEHFMVKTDLEQGNRTLVSKSKTSCFIATACYGSPDCSQVCDLRRFRDEVLLKSTFGIMVVSAYYHLSPPLALWLANHHIWRSLVRSVLIEPGVSFLRMYRRKETCRTTPST